MMCRGRSIPQPLVRCSIALGGFSDEEGNPDA